MPLKSLSRVTFQVTTSILCRRNAVSDVIDYQSVILLFAQTMLIEIENKKFQFYIVILMVFSKCFQVSIKPINFLICIKANIVQLIM